MKNFLMLLNIGVGSSVSTGLQRLTLEENYAVQTLHDINVEQEDGVCILFKNRSSNRTAYLKLDLLKKLDAVKTTVSERFNVERWNGMLSSRLENSKKRETLECVKECIFYTETDSSAVFRALEMLIVFDTIQFIPDTDSLSQLLQLALDLGYTRIEELYDEVLQKLETMHNIVRCFLEITPKTRCNDPHESLENAIADFSENICMDFSNTEEKYSDMKKRYNVAWKVDQRVLQRLITKNRLIEKKKENMTFSFMDNKIKKYKILLRLRIADYPEEKSAYGEALGVYTIEEYVKDNISDSEKTIINVNLFIKIESDYKNVLECNWHELTVYDDKDINSIFYNDKDREVSKLVYYGSYHVENVAETPKNKIIVTKSLVLKYLVCEIDFVNVENVEKVEIFNTRMLKFRCNDLLQVFTNTKTLSVEYSRLSILLCEDGTWLFPKLDVLLLKMCEITDDVYEIVNKNIRIIYIKKCSFVEGVTFESIVAQAKCRCIFFDTRCYKMFACALTSKESCGEIESSYNEQNDGSREMYTVNLPFSEIKKMLEQDPNSFESVRQRIEKSLVNFDLKFRLGVNTMRAVNEEIVFLRVNRIEDYMEAKKFCSLRSLRYLEISRMNYDYERKNVDSLSIKKHKLDVLVISNVIMREAEILIKRLFDERLVCLSIPFSYGAETKIALLDYFREIRVLSIEIEYSLSVLENDNVLKKVYELRELEVLEVLPASWRDCEDGRIYSFDLATLVLNRCTKIKKIVTVVYSFEIEKYMELRHVVRTYDNRRYKISIDKCAYERNMCARAANEIKLPNRALQNALLLEHAMREELERNGSINDGNMKLEITYELVA